MGVMNYQNAGYALMGLGGAMVALSFAPAAINPAGPISGGDPRNAMMIAGLGAAAAGSVFTVIKGAF